MDIGIKDVVVVIPIYKSSINSDEIDSLQQCFKVLSKYNITFVGPENLDTSLYEEYCAKSDIKFCFEKFESSFFESYNAYNQFCLSTEFYERFDDYEYLLIYQLDAWVFRDELLYWCRQGYDYIGAPFDKSYFKKIGLGNYDYGNGGFCLRKISSMIKLTSKGIKNKNLKKYLPLKTIFYLKKKKRFISNLLSIPIFLYHYVTQRKFSWQYMYNEDLIIGYYANKFMPEFKMPSSEIAEKFSLENTLDSVLPEIESGKRELPFGAHQTRFVKKLLNLKREQ